MTEKKVYFQLLTTIFTQCYYPKTTYAGILCTRMYVHMYMRKPL